MAVPRQVWQLTQERTIENRTKANLARRAIAPQHLDPYDDPEFGWVDPMDDPEVRTALKGLVARLWRNPLDPYGGDDV